MRAYGLTDDVDEGDGPDLSLSRSDAKPQVHACGCCSLYDIGSDHSHRFLLLNRMLLMFAGHPVLVQWRITSRLFSRAFSHPNSSIASAGDSRQFQRYLSDVQGQRLEKAGGEPGPSHVFGEDAAFDNEGAGEEDFERDVLMSQVRVSPG